MRLFKQTTTESLSGFILQTPTHKLNKTRGQRQSIEEEKLAQRRSPRLKGKSKDGKTSVKLAQYLIAKKCGIASTEEPLDHMSLPGYLDMYKKALTDPTMKAIITLTEVANEKKMKKLKVKKGKKADNREKEAGSRGKKKGTIEEVKHAASNDKKEKESKEKKNKSKKLTPSGVLL
jgi:hypothetical protein